MEAIFPKLQGHFYGHPHAGDKFRSAARNYLPGRSTLNFEALLASITPTASENDVEVELVITGDYKQCSKKALDNMVEASKAWRVVEQADNGQGGSTRSRQGGNTCNSLRPGDRSEEDGGEGSREMTYHRYGQPRHTKKQCREPKKGDSKKGNSSRKSTSQETSTG